jgi:hypothetical protein
MRAASAVKALVRTYAVPTASQCDRYTELPSSFRVECSIKAPEPEEIGIGTPASAAPVLILA